MVWRANDPQGYESRKIRWEIVPYTRGKVLDLGCGSEKAFKHFVGVDNKHHEREAMMTVNCDVVVETCSDLRQFGSQSWDAVFSSHLLEHIEDYKSALREWWRVIKRGGYLVLYLPHKSFYPNIGEEWANADHKHDFVPDDIVKAMQEIGGWDLVENQERNQWNEYSFFQVYRKRNDKQCKIVEKPKGKTAAVVRYGAIGDIMQTTSVIRQLKADGYHVTFYTNDMGETLLKHNPCIDSFIVQDQDQVPNEQLSQFFLYTKTKYDKFVNLSESVEGTLLAIPGRANHEWPQEFRHKVMNRNYMEFMHDMAGIKHEFAIEFHASPEEKQKALREREKSKGPVVLWTLSGSSVHKAYPHAHQVMARILYAYPDATIYTVGDRLCKIQEFAWEKEPRIKRKSGDWSIRETLAFLPHCTLIIGPETGVLNAAATMPVPKIVLLSHSSKENLTKHWLNTAALEPSLTSCYPCHRMHYNWNFCHQESQSHAALCQFNITVESVWQQVRFYLGEPLVKTPDSENSDIVLHDNKALLRDYVQEAIGAQHAV